MKKLIAIIMMTFGLVVGLGFGTQQASASGHAGTPSFAKGYWHTRGRVSGTYHIFKNHFWFRYSGWNRYGKHKWRAPWHGYDRVRYWLEPGSDGVRTSANVRAYDPQTGKHLEFTLIRVSKSKIYLNYNIYDPWYTLYRGAR